MLKNDKIFIYPNRFINNPPTAIPKMLFLIPWPGKTYHQIVCPNKILQWPSRAGCTLIGQINTLIG
jgi:hypothetical protein